MNDSFLQTSERTLDAPDILDDYYLNLLDWGSINVLSIALGSTVYLWDASEGSTSELVTVDDEFGPVTSVKWAPDRRHVAIGLNNSDVQLWDSTANRFLRTLRGGHQSRVGALDWNNHILTTGGMDGMIFNNDVRVRSHIVETYRGHSQEVCGLKCLKAYEEWVTPGGSGSVKDSSDQLLLTRAEWQERQKTESRQAGRGRGTGFSDHRGRGRGRGRPNGHGRGGRNPSNNNRSFGQDEQRGKRDRRNLRCYNCDKLGHFSAECRAPRRTDDEVNLAKEEDEPTLLMVKNVQDVVMLNEERVFPCEYAKESSEEGT
ncbi:unnamed protein product, partial [Cuscuta campestris]